MEWPIARKWRKYSKSLYMSARRGTDTNMCVRVSLRTTARKEYVNQIRLTFAPGIVADRCANASSLSSVTCISRVI